MTKHGRFGEQVVEGFRWRRWYAPLVVLVALLADYTSPAAMWTAALPLAFMAFLLTFRERTAALAVLFFSSWILIPVAAGTACAIDWAKGSPRVYGVQFTVPGVEPRQYAECHANQMPLSIIEVSGGDSPIERAEARVLSSFAGLHNTFAVWSAERTGRVVCDPPIPLLLEL